jgi:serine/threonine protein kinase
MSLAPEANQRIQRRVGATVRGKYRLDRLLGIGGMAAVYQATHRNGSQVALKMLHPELARLADVRTRFLREGYVANRIAHPGVTRVIDDDDDDEGQTVFLVLELLEGETLDARSQRLGGRLPLNETLVYADALLDVLVAAHEQGIVHRDVKPDNLFVTTRGELKVLDFGIARLLDGTGATRSGQLLGTPAFMSPEQANGRIREIDGRTDLWSTGAVIFTLLTGSEVHVASTPPEQMIYAATQQARPIESLTSWLAPDIALLVNQALAFDRNARWPTARAMQASLRATSSFGGLHRSPSVPVAAIPTQRPALSGTVDMLYPAGVQANATLVHGSSPSGPEGKGAVPAPRRRP